MEQRCHIAAEYGESTNSIPSKLRRQRKQDCKVPNPTSIKFKSVKIRRNTVKRVKPLIRRAEGT